MDKMEKLIAEHLKKNFKPEQAVKTANCPAEEALLQYLEGNLPEKDRQALEYHLADCSFCLSQVSLAFEARLKHKQGSLDAVPQELIEKTKSLLVGLNNRHKKDNKTRTLKRRLFLAAAVLSFVLSFVIPKYFMQCLVVTLILGIRWALESEGGRTLIMVLDSWRRHSHATDAEITRRLKNR